MTDKLLHDALHQYEQIGPAKMDRSDLNIIRDAAAKASLLARENEQLVADYGERGDLLAECRVRVSALEALLAECVEIISELLCAATETNYDPIRARALLVKLKARTS